MPAPATRLLKMSCTLIFSDIKKARSFLNRPGFVIVKGVMPSTVYTTVLCLDTDHSYAYQGDCKNFASSPTIYWLNAVIVLLLNY